MSFIEKNKIDVPNFSVVTLFTTALCNLNCGYCYICKDKDGNLKQIDDDIKEMFDTGQHIKQVLDVDPNIKYSLDTISLWGGEPFLGVYRFIDHIEEWFSTFENLRNVDASTNLCLPDHFERIQDLVNAIERMYDKYHKPNRKYHLTL